MADMAEFQLNFIEGRLILNSKQFQFARSLRRPPKLQLYKVQLLRAAARYPGGRGGEGPKCPEFSGARVEISDFRIYAGHARMHIVR
jgi:hypothetical protein